MDGCGLLISRAHNSLTYVCGNACKADNVHKLTVSVNFGVSLVKSVITLSGGIYVRMLEKRQGVKISAPEEIAFRNGWINKDALLKSAKKYGKSPYGSHLKAVAEGRLVAR